MSKDAEAAVLSHLTSGKNILYLLPTLKNKRYSIFIPKRSEVF
ncbi:hypothetical protein LEP1GSC170_1306 [Leptospira interrogans serovar Bataviae str. HAI135]|nr:hypothetical protein LEP1GSC170_1306 [Leptospira interrogans serovar Bataviae str. HAI135]